MPAKTAIKCGTLEGAKAIGFDEVGAVTTGYKADLVLYDLKEPEWFPAMTAIPFFAMPPVPTVSAMFCRWKIAL